jgi:hypothetical protein
MSALGLFTQPGSFITHAFGCVGAAEVAEASHAITKGCGPDDCNSVLGRMSLVGQFLPPTFATAMEELARRPDAKAPNRRAAP